MTPGLLEGVLGEAAELLSRQNRKKNTLSAGTLDEAATEHAFAVIEYHRLARSDRRDGLVERDLELVTVDAHDLRRGQRCPMTDAHAYPASDRRSISKPVDLARDQTATEQLLACANDYRACIRFDGDHVHRLRESPGHTAPLADGVSCESGVLTDYRTVG